MLRKLTVAVFAAALIAVPAFAANTPSPVSGPATHQTEKPQGYPVQTRASADQDRRSLARQLTLRPAGSVSQRRSVLLRLRSDAGEVGRRADLPRLIDGTRE